LIGSAFVVLKARKKKGVEGKRKGQFDEGGGTFVQFSKKRRQFKRKKRNMPSDMSCRGKCFVACDGREATHGRQGGKARGGGKRKTGVRKRRKKEVCAANGRGNV